MTAFLALVAVVGYMATAHLPWWVVVAVALLMAGFAAGRSWSPARGAVRSPEVRRCVRGPGPVEQQRGGLCEEPEAAQGGQPAEQAELTGSSAFNGLP
ncbi:hypothetical protein [Streptomyces bicolor]|uniref:hypothetical protein n=1 Tax=Streptomyces bicolor TaxID=66874 RepID=UPI0004E179A1|nr:hypothetical protein [Streptomyces bicolor]